MLDLLSRGWIPTHNIWNAICLGDGYFKIITRPLMEQCHIHKTPTELRGGQFFFLPWSGNKNVSLIVPYMQLMLDLMLRR
jgi:hypothetical protein